jgi:hypothetical protein
MEYKLIWRSDRHKHIEYFVGLDSELMPTSYIHRCDNPLTECLIYAKIVLEHSKSEVKIIPVETED